MARLAAILASISGEQSIAEACVEAGVGEARFFEMHKEFLSGALALLEKRPSGRKPAERPDAELEQLREENERLRLEAQATRLSAPPTPSGRKHSICRKKPGRPPESRGGRNTAPYSGSRRVTPRRKQRLQHGRDVGIAGRRGVMPPNRKRRANRRRKAIPS